MRYFDDENRIPGRWTKLATYTHKKRRPRVAYLQYEVLALPYNSNKQQETYADMTNHLAMKRQVGVYVIPIGIYCYFGLEL